MEGNEVVVFVLEKDNNDSTKRYFAIFIISSNRHMYD